MTERMSEQLVTSVWQSSLLAASANGCFCHNLLFPLPDFILLSYSAFFVRNHSYMYKLCMHICIHERMYTYIYKYCTMHTCMHECICLCIHPFPHPLQLYTILAERDAYPGLTSIVNVGTWSRLFPVLVTERTRYIWRVINPHLGHNSCG